MKTQEEITIEVSELKDYHKFFNLIKKNIDEHTISIHIKQNFLYPIDILLITQSIIFFKNHNCLIKIISNQTIKNYLDNIGLINFCKQNYKAPSTIEAIPSFSAMPIRRVNEENMTEYIDTTQNYFSNICEGKDLTMLNNCLAELINNVYNHSYSPIGAYVFSQYYPQKNEIRFAVSDLGIGIPESINNYLVSKNEAQLSAIDCTKWALKENNTTQSIPQNRGKGLNNVSSFVSANKGSFKLFTNEVRITKYSGGNNNYSKNPIFNQIGTLIEVTIKVNHLEKVEIVDNFDW